MALQLTSVWKGLTLTNSYHKIKHVDGNKDKMYFNVQMYVNKETSDLDTQNNNYLSISEIYSIIPDLNSEDNIWVQMYDYLKTLDTYANALDV